MTSNSSSIPTASRRRMRGMSRLSASVCITRSTVAFICSTGGRAFGPTSIRRTCACSVVNSSSSSSSKMARFDSK